MAKKIQQVTQPKSAGRPKGAVKQEYPQSSGELTRCPACKGTKRGPYLTKTVTPFAGLTIAGEPFTEVWHRRTICECGQARVDQHYVNVPANSKKEII